MSQEKRFGENVGVEINGKSSRFTRPVLVLKKMSRLGFMGAPLTSQIHRGSWYASFWSHGREQIAVLSQLRFFSVSRLHNKMRQVDDSDMAIIKKNFYDLFCQ